MISICNLPFRTFLASTSATTSPTCGKVTSPLGEILSLPPSFPKITYTQYTSSFTASSTLATLSFIIMGEGGNGAVHYWLLDEVSVNHTNTNADVLTNGNFETGDLSGWTQYCNTNVNCDVRLPAGDNETSLLNLVVYVRDLAGSVTQVNISSVNIIADSVTINDLIDKITNLSSTITNNPIVRLLSSGNQNVVGQIMTALSQEFNQMNSENLDKAISSGIPAATILVSSLGSSSLQQVSLPLNESALINYNIQLNSLTNVRDYLVTFITNLLITTSNSIILQSSSLVQLTQSTNQLTRNTLLLVSNRCYELSAALYAMFEKISYEDAQSASNQLFQCASNILNAVNGPLQGRTEVLDLDSSRANAISTDYDTDLESAWSNLNLFSDGNDFSIETIEKNRNIYYQKQLANRINSQVTQIISLLTSSLNIHLNIGQSSLMNTSQSFVSLETISIQSLKDRLVKQVENAQFNIPSDFILNTTSNTSISLRSKIDQLASYGNFQNTNLSRSISLSIIDQNGNEVSFQAHQDNPIQLIIPRDPNVLIPSMYLQNVTSINSTINNLLFNYHYINITSSLPISVHFEIHSLNRSLAYLFIYKFDQTPQLNSSINLIDGWTIFCPFNLTNDDIYRYFIDNQQTLGHQSLIFGIRELNSTEINNYCLNSSSINTSLPITDESINFTSNYELLIYTSGCYYLDENNNWKSDGLIVGSLTNLYKTECLSTHLTTFAGGFIVLPAPINWSYVFANADFMKNKTVYLTMIFTSVIYIILMIYARFKDKKDFEKLGVTPLADNNKSDHYYYQILVFTGQRTNAGTDSKVYFVLSGDNDQTQIRLFSDPHRKIFQRGGINSFIIAVPKSLGLLNYIRIWHDNTGEGSSASWFLKYIIVRDLQTLDKFYFISQQWFAVEKDDGRIERTLPIASDAEKQEFSYVLSKKAYHSISDGHLWFSIFSRPPSNKFTRVQRCTCCFVLFFTSMLINIMYYDLSNEANASSETHNGALSIGPFYIAPQQIGIGIMVELFTLIPSLLIVQFFRRIPPRQQVSRLREALYKMKPSRKTSSEDIPAIKKKKSSITFPWWCLFIAYGLSMIIIIISIFFIIVRGIEFGDVKTQQWLTSVLTGFFSSVIFTQPIKIICLAIFFICFCRNSKDEKETSEYINEDDEFNISNDEEYLHSLEYRSIFSSQSRKSINRLNANEIIYARDQRLKEIQMWTIIREFFIYFIFAILVFIITYSNREQHSFSQVNHLRAYFLNQRQTTADYTQINTIDEYWYWLENSFVSNIRAQQWYNGDIPQYLNGFLNDKSSRLIGWATIRQLRVKSELCPDQRVISICEDSYSFSNEETQLFQPGWTTNATTEEFSSSVIKAFNYSTSDELDTYSYIGEFGTYRGGGYVYEFRGRLSDMKTNLTKLHQLEWIDEKTRAVFIQLTLYNPSVQLLTAVTLLAEFLPTSGVYTTARFEPINFYTFTSLLQLVCTIFYIFFIIYFMIIEIRILFELRLKYFRQFWSLIQLGIIGCSLGSIGIYFWRFEEANRISELFEQTNGYIYINLQRAVYVNDILTFLLGYCCFFSTIKCLQLLRFNQQISLFAEILKYCAKALISFSIMFAIVFMAYLCLFYLLFVSKLSSCSSLLETAQMLFEMTLMKFDASQIMAADAFLGPFCFALFMFLVVFVCLSMFVSIISDSFRHAKDNQKEDQIIFSFMLKKFLRWSGLKKLNQEEIQEERDCRMHSQYFDPIENFPDKIDQLLEAFNKLQHRQQVLQQPVRLRQPVPQLVRHRQQVSQPVRHRQQVPQPPLRLRQRVLQV
ncbi:unnamed protein product [Adineta steineri]|uniref:PLAT domain-containing protein n=4 Tax=Adineta steineri TaxID=433720 RepID=A0A814GS54_9BILA|nr:unnamed protein product [Adineta steineri]